MDARESMKKQNELAMFLGRHVFSSEAKHSNIVFSPASIYSALTLLASAPSEPSVADEILCFLKSSSTDELNAVFTELVSLVYTGGNASGGPEISSVNGVWIEKTLSIDPKFKDLLENFFKAAFKLADFESKAEEVRTEVNSWVQERTNDLIKDLLPPGSVTNETERVYANALYFKGTWNTPFDDYDTRKREFYLLDGSTVSVPFMTSDEDQYIAAYDGLKVARLPFEGARGDTSRKFAMYFYLPSEKDGLDNLVERIATTPGFLDAHIPSREVEVGTFRIPKFEISFGFLVSEVFGELGLGSNSLYHKACIKIDESGVEAAAATADEACGCYFGMEPPKRIDFVANKPFLFLIREDTTGTVLFAGQIFDPSQSS
ncbi:Serpin domain-containing protein [Hirschfeldia incana]|nr:Serpin domain-containing protein [Hirschfeldia incana]